jgi:hypothetical protein
MTTELKLEVGKRYRRRDGEVVTISWRCGSEDYPFVANTDYSYDEDGRYLSGDEHAFDLVEEVADEQPQSDDINNPSHYTQFPVDVIELAENLMFNLGNVVKYVCRCEFKGDTIKDLKKAKWYLEREIMRREKK